MSFRATLAQLVAITGASPFNLSSFLLEQQVTGISTDTRTLKPGEVFMALRGESFDGHRFLSVAKEKGAIAAVVDHPIDQPLLPLLQVSDTLQTYQAIARWWRDQFEAPVIAVTGSVGKTTTKELIAAVLSHAGAAVLKSEANFNNEIGVPKTLLGLDSAYKFAVVEMGMRAAGEIALLTRIAHPDIAVITNVGTAHIGRLGSEAAIAQAKCELLAEMPPTSTAILNHDNPLLLQTAATVWRGRSITYGLEGGDIRGSLPDPETLVVGDYSFPLPLPGRHNALNFLAALAVAKVLGLDWAELTTELALALPGGRARRYSLPNDIVILDETYNAGLESMLAALELLAQTPGKRRIAVLGTMRELGDRSCEFHQRVGLAVQRLHLDRLLILAEAAESEALKTGALPVVAEEFSSHGEVVERLQEMVQPGDRLLFKASRAVGLDRVVDEFCSQYRATVGAAETV
jgi:UDP-N-acetylmuramoyl-tripeptide--D-alanyl-D-alanine ligase